MTQLAINQSGCNDWAEMCSGIFITSFCLAVGAAFLFFLFCRLPRHNVNAQRMLRNHSHSCVHMREGKFQIHPAPCLLLSSEKPLLFHLLVRKPGGFKVGSVQTKNSTALRVRRCDRISQGSFLQVTMAAVTHGGPYYYPLCDPSAPYSKTALTAAHWLWWRHHNKRS